MPSSDSEKQTSVSPSVIKAPDSIETQRMVRSGVLIGILALFILYTAYFAAAILIPMALAFLFSLILSPVVGWLVRLHIPSLIGAALVIVVLLIGFAAGMFALYKPAMHWVKEAPRVVRKVEHSFRSVSGPINAIHETEQKVESLSQSSSTRSSRPQPVKIVGQGNGIEGRVLSIAPHYLTSAGIAIVLLYFLLGGSDTFLRKIAHIIPRWSDKKRVVEVVRGIQHNISRYLFTITLINLGLGIVDGVMLWLVGMPNPLLWGVMVALFNYVPYLGAITSILILTLIAFITFNHIGLVLVVPGVMIAVSILEGQFVTPHVVGRRLEISPVAVFIMLVISGWMWGVVGIIMAVPFLVSFKIMCEEIPVLGPVAEFLTAYSSRSQRLSDIENEDAS